MLKSLKKRVGGTFHWEIVGLDGRIRVRGSFLNGVTDAGINDILDKYFRSGTPPTNWYMGLISATNYSALDDDDDTMSSHSGWEEDQQYDEANRPEWAPAAATSQKLDNSTSVKFTMNAETTIQGLFITSDNTIGGTSGTLWATGLLNVPVAVKSGEVFRGYYDLTGAEG